MAVVTQSDVVAVSTTRSTTWCQSESDVVENHYTTCSDMAGVSVHARGSWSGVPLLSSVGRRKL